MRDDVILETTGEMIIYYGTSLNEAEVNALTEICKKHDPVPVTNGQFWGEFSGERYRIPLDDDRRPPHIGHRVVQKTVEPASVFRKTEQCNRR
ncbi:MAG TPA: hypothetical protein VG055_29840 [Planctomycetaceae bacterium]|nr:hypothetical protein [Planctomycetaceae bacterium]